MSDTKTPFRWPVPWKAEAKDPPVYLLRRGSVIERELLEAELAGERRAGMVYPFQLRAAFAEGIRLLVGESAPEDAERLIALSAQRGALGEGEEMAGDEIALLEGAEAVLIEHYLPYRALIAQGQRREALAPVLAFQRFCVGWENVDAPFATDWTGVRPEAMAAITPAELRGAGLKAYGLCYMGAQPGN